MTACRAAILRDTPRRVGADLRMLLACIDIGSNTTRLLVAEPEGGRLRPVEERRSFTCIAGSLTEGRLIPRVKIEEVVAVVQAQLSGAEALGAAGVRIFATAGVRAAANGAELVRRLREACEREVRVLSAQEEARLAFLGAAAMAPRPAKGTLAVIDLGGGSCEIAAGRHPAEVQWSCSLPLGSARLRSRWLVADPPAAPQLQAARQGVEQVLESVELPLVDEVLAVGGSATSLRRVVGERLDEDALSRALREVCARSAPEVAQRFGLDPARARLLPGGLVVLEALARRFGRPLEVGQGGVREGVLLEAAA
jgi:exopolyphosphatase/guanosine-5'-triphosphate,3'-diphosphate pyrophosphatase